MAQEAIIDGNLINDERPLAVEEQGAVEIQGRASGTLTTPRLDAVTSSWQTVSYPHHKIHDGSHFYIEGHVELDDTETLYVKLVTPDTTKWAHFTWDISSSGICATTFDEDATGGMTGGAGITPLNNDRNSATASGLVITRGVTIAGGYITRISNAKWGAGGKFAASGGGQSRENEIILKQDAVYLRTFTSGADDNIIQFRASWYEHTSVA